VGLGFHDTPLDVEKTKAADFQRLGLAFWIVLDVVESKNGRHDWIRTNDLFRVKFPHNCNPLILRASAAPKSIENHSKSMFSTIVSTIKTRKEEVAEEV